MQVWDDYLKMLCVKKIKTMRDIRLYLKVEVEWLWKALKGKKSQESLDTGVLLCFMQKKGILYVSVGYVKWLSSF